ncbi:short chain dehydrogenase [Paenibacillus sp.]|uniref:short chain dehydrogenase n=1 Tax=Paenibacillus sp. TaxID=58172 RepID=UPI002D4410C0|nr:short chain dehydrogenase [Paenibacillus sp.]HZG88455.1 short chain dehydrogenase [Paenibacillus sp.]
MRILLIGATGAIGSAVYKDLVQRHEVVTAGRSTGDVQVEIASAESIAAMFEQVGCVDAVVSTPGAAYFGALSELTPEKNEIAIQNKLKGQINLVLLGHPYVADRGSFTLTTGIIMDDPVAGGASAAMASGGVKAFVQAAAIEMPREIRINNVSPNVLEVSSKKYEPYFPGFIPVSSERVAQAFRKSVEGAQTGKTYTVY